MITHEKDIHNLLKNISQDTIFSQISNGLYHIEEYSHSSPSDMINGIVQSSLRSKKFVSKKKLDIDDVISISKIARHFQNIDKEIAWLESGLKITKNAQYRQMIT